MEKAKGNDPQEAVVDRNYKKWYFGYQAKIKQSAFFQRKETLIDRDPLAKELKGKLETWNPPQDLSQEILSLKETLEKKWAVHLFFTKGTLVDSGKGAAHPLPDSRGPLIIVYPFPGHTEALWAWRLNSSFPHRKPSEKQLHIGVVLPSDDKLVIQVDLNLLDRGGDTRYVKNIMASLIDRCLKERKEERRVPLIAGEPKELAFLYHGREQTFQNYLRWYDLHVGTDYNNPNGFSFRAIAFCEYVLRNHPEKYEDAKAGIAKRTKAVRTARGERVLKGVVGDHIKGEDAVEKAVKIVYGSIHRKPYPSKKTKQKEYNCPKHGVSCPKDCFYLKTFVKDFNRRNMLFLPLNTTDPATLPQVVGDERSHSKHKPTADQQSK